MGGTPEAGPPGTAQPAIGAWPPGGAQLVAPAPSVGAWPPRTRWPEPAHRAVAAVRAVLEESAAPRTLVALSGGADSLALAVACALLLGTRAGERCGPVGAVVVDHGLQPGSAGVAAAAAGVARVLGLVPVSATRVQVGASGEGPEAEARRARRAALAEAAVGERSTGEAARSARSEPTPVPPPALVLTAHTADDQAEQVLLGLARGSGTRSLAGIPVRGELPGGVAVARPLLGLTRADTEAVCRWAGITWFEDPHNRDPALLRSRIRTAVLPRLEDPDVGLGPGVRAALVRTAAIAAEDAQALDHWAAEAFASSVLTGGDTGGADGGDAGGADGGDGGRIALDLDALAAQPAAVRHRVLARAAALAGAAATTRERLLAADALVTRAHDGGVSAGPVELAGGVRVRRTPGPRTAAGEGPAGGGGGSPCARLEFIPRRPGP